MSQTAITETSSPSPAIAPIQGEPARLHRTSLREYCIRFLFGGLATAAVGIIATAFGPTVAGLFLAFPAILIATLTLVGSHDGSAAAGADALGAAIGAAGLIAFGAVIWRLSERVPGVLTLALASAAWFVIAVTIWTVFDASRRHRKD